MKEEEIMQSACYYEAAIIRKDLTFAIRQIETYMLGLNKAQEMGKEKYDRKMWHYGAYDDLMAQEEAMKTVLPKCDKAIMLIIKAMGEAYKVMQIIQREMETIPCNIAGVAFEVNRDLYFDVVCVLERLKPYIQQCTVKAFKIYQYMKESQAFDACDLAVAEEWIHTLKELADYVNYLPENERNE